MAVAVEQRALQARCYACQSSEVQALCHHCWRPGCARHVHPTPHWAQRLFGAEAGGPGLENSHAWHCADCNHVRAGWWLRVGTAGLVVMFVGLLIVLSTLASLVLGLLMIVVGCAAATWAFARIRRGSARSRAERPVPLHPRVSDVRLVERLRAHIYLGPRGDYVVRTAPVNGELTTTLTFGANDLDRVQSYRNMRKLRASQQVSYTVGCFVPQGRLSIKGLGEGHIVRADGDVSNIAAFQSVDAPISSPRKERWPYWLSEAPENDMGPVWITPSIRPGSHRHVLELDIQWTEFSPKTGRPLVLETVASLKLTVPADWGNVQGASRRPDMISRSDAPDGARALQELEWRQVVLDDTERETRHLAIAVQFEEHIAVSDILSGKLVGILKGTLSGADGLWMYNALGERRDIPGGARIRTRVDADFTLSLASIRYQEIRVFPEHTDTGGCAIESAVIPADETVIALTNALSEEGFYVKRVTENAPRNGGRPGIVHRVWDITGRSYQGVYPTDFHLVLTGDEVHSGDVRPESGSTRVKVVVQGAYNDDEMFKQVENTWTSLCAVTRDALTRVLSRAYGPDME